MMNVTLSNISDFVSYEASSCAAVNDRLVILYRRSVNAKIVEYGQCIHVDGDVDDILNRDNWQDFVTKVAR